MNSKTLFYILKRILLAVFTVWVVITITFFVMHSVPGGPFVGEKATTPAVQAAMEAKYGLDKPLHEQYFTYLGDIVTKFDFGPSLKQRGRMVIDIISDGMKTSMVLGLIAAGVSTLFGVTLGAVAALRRNKLIDRIIMVITTAFVSMPSFIMGSLLLALFAIQAKAAAGKRLHGCGFGAADYHAGALSYGIYHPSDTLLHAGRSRSGLYPHRKGKGRFGPAHHLRSCAEKLAHPCFDLYRSDACLHRYRLACC